MGCYKYGQMAMILMGFFSVYLLLRTVIEASVGASPDGALRALTACAGKWPGWWRLAAF